jgi:HlyD family secretion protein
VTTIARPTRRTLLLVLLAALVVAGLVLGFREPPPLVDAAEVARGPFRVTVEEEGRTRVKDRYKLSAPIAGQIGRVSLEPGDRVAPGDALFVIDPQPAVPLDARTRAQAQATLARAGSALQASQTQMQVEQARAALADSELARLQPLAASGHVSAAALERAQAEARSATAALRSARFAVDVARHERDVARAALGTHDVGPGSAPLQVRSPVAATVLRRLRESAGAVQPGEEVLTLGDLDSLEVEVDVLSPDAVRLQPGMRVEFERWGGDETLTGRVRRVEPSGFTKISALGVEEQRVWVVVEPDGERDAWRRLGDGYRVEARFVVWQDDDVLQVPAGALFREDDRWAAYVIDGDRLRHRQVSAGRRSGLLAQVLDGLQPGERVVLHPGRDLRDGTRVRVR